MSDYAHTYDLRQGYEGFEDLPTDSARELGDRVNQAARNDGLNRYDLLVAEVRAGSATRADAEALNVLWGGPTGEFLG